MIFVFDGRADLDGIGIVSSSTLVILICESGSTRSDFFFDQSRKFDTTIW